MNFSILHDCHGKKAISGLEFAGVGQGDLIAVFEGDDEGVREFLFHAFEDFLHAFVGEFIAGGVFPEVIFEVFADFCRPANF